LGIRDAKYIKVESACFEGARQALIRQHAPIRLSLLEQADVGLTPTLFSQLYREISSYTQRS
jgi:hypothetical protein